MKKTNGFGVAALICGICGIVLSCIVVGIVPAVVGLVLGIVGVCKKDKPKGTSIAGIICSFIGIIAFIISLTMGIGLISSTDLDDSDYQEEITSDTREEIIDDETGGHIEESNSEESTNETSEEQEESEYDYKASCQEYAYKDVLRNPDEYIGERIKVTVKISSVHEESWSNDCKYYFAYSDDGSGWYFENRYGVFDRREEQNPKLLEDDIITVYGEIAETEETQSLIVNSEEIFCIDMKYIDFISE